MENHDLPRSGNEHRGPPLVLRQFRSINGDYQHDTTARYGR